MKLLSTLLSALALLVPPGLAAAANFTWDPANSYSNAGFTVSGKIIERTASGAANWSARSTEQITSGIVTFKAKFEGLAAADDIGIGIGDTGIFPTIAGTFPGQGGSHSIGLFSDGTVAWNGSVIATAVSGGFANGDIAEGEVDVTGQTIRFRKNGGTWSTTYSVAGISAAPWWVIGVTYAVGNKVTFQDYTVGGSASHGRATKGCC